MLLYEFLLLFSSLKEFLPKEYIKQRGAEKKIFQVWSSCPLKEMIVFILRLSILHRISPTRAVAEYIYYVYFNLQEHKNCGEMTEIEAKVKYVKLARSLRTYGVSFFLVKVSCNTNV